MRVCEPLPRLLHDQHTAGSQMAVLGAAGVLGPWPRSLINQQHTARWSLKLKWHPPDIPSLLHVSSLPADRSFHPAPSLAVGSSTHHLSLHLHQQDQLQPRC
jgi:hypothetical protein